MISILEYLHREDETMRHAWKVVVTYTHGVHLYMGFIKYLCSRGILLGRVTIMAYYRNVSIHLDAMM